MNTPAIKIKEDFMKADETLKSLSTKAVEIGESIGNMNCYHFMTTIVEGIPLATFRIANIPMVMEHICIPLHKKYSNFSETLLKAREFVESKKTAGN